MPVKCCVPLCRGNYSNGPKVSVYSFPKSQELVFKWVYAIKRANFVPTANTKVCELHFKKEDFEYEASAFDEKNGCVLTAPLKYKRLKKSVIPTVFPNYPSHFQPLLTEVKREEEEEDE